MPSKQECLEFLKRNKTSLIMAILLIAGIALRLAFTNRTDITTDEAFYVKFAYKIASLGWKAPWLVWLGIIAGLVVFYAIAIRKSLKIALLFAAAILGAKYLLGLGYLTHAPSPLFIIVTSAVIFFTNLMPNIAGELVSGAAAIALAFTAYFIGKWQWNEKVGIIAFALLLLSPFSIFVSGASHLGLLGMALFYASLGLFIKGLDNSKLLPLSGFVYALAIAARYASLIGIPFFLFLLWDKRKSLEGREAKKHAAIFLVMTFSVVGFFAPMIMHEFAIPTHWDTGEDAFRHNMFELHYSGPVADATGGEVHFYGDSYFMLNLMSLFYSPAFLLLLAAAIGYSAGYSFRNKDNALAVFLLIFLLMFAFFGLVLQDKRINYLVEPELPAMLLVAFLLGNKKLGFEKARAAIAIALVLLFAWQSIAVIQAHDFRGVSSALQAVPEGSSVYVTPAGQRDVFHYYMQTYLYDTEVNRPALFFLFPRNEENAAIFEQKSSLLKTGKAPGDVDYAFIDTLAEERGAEIGALASFIECTRIKSGNYTVYRVLARNAGLCDALENQMP